MINGKEMPDTLFGLIRKTSKVHPRLLVSAYKDNVAFIEGPLIEQFAPMTQDKPDFFFIKDIQSVISLKAETHNFPTTVEPFNGAATGSGGEIRDRMAGGKGSIPACRNCGLYDFLSQDRRGKKLGNSVQGKKMAVPGSGRDPHQSIKRGQ